MSRENPTTYNDDSEARYECVPQHGTPREVGPMDEQEKPDPPPPPPPGT